MVSDERAKLKTMLTHLIEHNRAHGSEFREWAEKARALGQAEVSKEILAAAQATDKVAESLSRALKRLG